MNPNPRAEDDDAAAADPAAPVPCRLFLYENGWRIMLKLGSDREFCYMMAPGQDHYHRLLDGEVILVRDDEKLCLACAQRRGLLSYEPRVLGNSEPIPVRALDLVADESEEGL